MASLNKIRTKINKIDNELMALLHERILFCEKLAQIKKTNGLKLTDKDRELEIIVRLQTEMGSRFNKTEIECFIKTILRISKLRMKKITKKHHPS